ncbi:hypothetical protein JW851_04955 [Candidatus Woesearchaeota archaeon]|nr:hypothetical protein [Candidatus Woesearchaeota archaeon]
MLRKLIFGLMLLILLSSLASAAVIEGKIYDIELNELSNVKIEVNTVPRQILVSTDGSYSFNLPSGTYSITATYSKEDLKIIEHVTVKDQGTYNLDLILFPDLDPEAEILNEVTEIDIANSYFEEDANTLGRLTIIIVLAVLAGLIIFIWFKFKSKTEEIKKEVEKKVAKASRPPVPEDLKDLVKFIKQEGGRTTQKDIRKHIPLSEAKISLMIAELEDKGLIKKIKKGRGNIIVLK